MAAREDEVETESSEEREQFLKDLTEYHQKRGTYFDPNPKVGPKYIDLYRLWQMVNEQGGYDRVSDTKGNKLAWRRITSDFQFTGPHIVQLAFQMKTTYYKFLAAYEISKIHQQEPPPREILEDLTAKGGDLLTRTLENYGRRAVPELEKLTNGNGSDESDNENGDSKVDKMDLDDAGTGGRVTRGLRQAPPQRVLYGQTPEQLKGRSATSYESPTPVQPIVFGTGAAAVSIANYEPRPAVPAQVKAVQTPANNPNLFRDLAVRQKKSLRRNQGIDPIKGSMLPGTGFTGPNIYIRCLRALESGLSDEVRYALHHLVKISFERGDKFLFSQFTNLADELMRKVCTVSTAWYEHPGWQYTWACAESDNPALLNQLSGTSDLVAKIQEFPLRDIGTVHSNTFEEVVSTACQACLVLRNMIVLEDNARYLADMPLIRDMMIIVFQLPVRAETVELKYYALEIAETLTRQWVLDNNDEFYLSLLDMLEQNLSDRGLIIIGLHALSRIALEKEAINRLENVPTTLLQRISRWVLVEDDELRTACLDFLYQYTAVTENVAHLVKVLDSEALVDAIMEFLMLGAIRIALNSELASVDEDQQVTVSSASAEILPRLSSSVMLSLCQIADPKEQSSAWLRTCFIQDPQGEITQLELWSAYNEAFSRAPSDNQLMVAKDFITNVTTVFPAASARVVPHEHDRSRSKYTMKGIAPRAVPTDVRGRGLVRCQWKIPARQTAEGDLANGTPAQKECDLWFSSTNVEELWNHMVEVHLDIPKDPDNPKKFNDRLVRDTGRKFACLWSGCTRYPIPGINEAYKICMHIKTHLPESGAHAPVKVKDATQAKRSRETGKMEVQYLNTPVDDKGHPTGLPLTALLVLRNLARQMLKLDVKDMRGRQSLIERHFALHFDRICYITTCNYSLRHHAPEFMQYISRGLAMAHKVLKLSNGVVE